MVGGVVGLRAQLMPGAALARIPRESEAAQA
jgi:hypothetical protein